jgi:hypothetical protein
MSANKIAETSTSTGTGDFTLAGAWSVPDSFINGNRTFNSFYGLNHRFPYMIQDKSGNWEKGRGHLSGAAVLVRETVIDNSLGTTALIDFAAGDKLVMVPTDAGSLWPETLDAESFLFTGGVYGYNNSVISIGSNTLRLGLYHVHRPIVVTAAVFDITTLAAASQAKPVIYKARNYLRSSMTVDLVAAGAAADSSSTGVKESSITATLGQGVYLVGLVSDGNPSARCNNAGTMFMNGTVSTFSGNATGTYSLAVSGSFASPPSETTGSFGENSQSIWVGLKGRLL